MFALAILLGIYSYLIFCLGLIGQLKTVNILILSLFFLIGSVKYFKKEYPDLRTKRIRLDKTSKIFLLIIIVLCLVNLIGALGPELGFDALWYHLTLPKLFLSISSISHIPGGLFYYSDMPKLAEIIYTAILSFGNETLVKLLHFSFGILSLLALFKLSRKFLNLKYSLLCIILFASNLVFSWESITAYSDLAWTFFEIMTIWGIINYLETRDKKWLLEAGVVFGLSVSTKLISLYSLPIFLVLFFVYIKNRKIAFKDSILFITVSCLIALPWFLLSFLNTGNPLYPVFSKYYQVGFNISLLNPVNFFKDIINLFLNSPDPISPIYIIFLPLIVIIYKKFDKSLKLITLYCLLSLISWYLIPRSGGGRFILPYLPGFSILAVGIVNCVENIKLKKYLLGLIIVVALITITYRGLANFRFVPVILGQESKDKFLTNNLNFSYGDFYDTDNYFKEHIKKTDMVLLYGFHNLYYADFPFIDSSYVKTGDKFNYIAVQNAVLPTRFNFWRLVYVNPKTNVKLYSLGGAEWSY